MAEKISKGDPVPMGYEEALALAVADGEGWEKAQIVALENYLVVAVGRSHSPRSSKFHERLRELGEYTLEDLTALGEEYNVLADFDLEAEGLKAYCIRHNIALSG